MKQMVHAIGWASHGSLQIYCSGEEDEASWHLDKTLPKEIYNTAGGKLYSFVDENVTCPECQTKHRRL